MEPINVFVVTCVKYNSDGDTLPLRTTLWRNREDAVAYGQTMIRTSTTDQDQCDSICEELNDTLSVVVYDEDMFTELSIDISLNKVQ